MYSNEFVCASFAKDKWYHYYDHRWNDTEQGVELRRKISFELVKRFKPIAIELTKKLWDEKHDSENDGEDETGNKVKDLQKQIERLNKLSSNLKSTPFKNNIMKECKEVFYKKEFAKKLDSNPYLLSFTNGVFDFKEMKFRDGSPEDCISLCTGYDYKEFSEEDDEVIFVRDFLKKYIQIQN